jgi:hypothetical protein
LFQFDKYNHIDTFFPLSSLQGVSSLILFPLFATGGIFATSVVDIDGKFTMSVTDTVVHHDSGISPRIFEKIQNYPKLLSGP